MHALLLGAKVVSSSNYYGQNSGPALFGSILCTGFEQRLIECPRTPFSGTCTSHVGVECRAGEKTTVILIRRALF